jgi:hydroxyacyl-ACP dehydratase HTD2-like protein with hotdog domain
MRPAARTRWDALAPGQALPERAFTPSIAELFLYSAVIWNAHRIHYDRDYAVNTEGHAGLLITGPLQGDWLCQTVTDWLGEDGTLERFAFSHRQPATLGETLTAGGRIVAKDAATGRVTLELALRNGAGDLVTPGEAVVRFA